ncbi:MAG: hypothetical protein JWP97_1595 [Labilithrix sp.]|nr:hypothetical protein [Labilithrix sp.]
MCIDAREALTWWTPDPLAFGLVTVSSAIYVRGLRVLGPNHGVRTWERACFFAGQLALLVALVSPVDRLSDVLFSAHMSQHEIIMLVAPPLIVLGRPWVALLFALSPVARARVTRRMKEPRLLAWFRVAAHPVTVVLLHALVIWVWHVPSLFEAALRSEPVHAVQHGMFFVTAALFWWSIVRGRHGRAGYGLAALLVFATAMHTSVLGALLTVTTKLWYPLYAERAAPWGEDAAGDQSLAGIVMWVPSGVLLTLLALGLFATWLGEAARRVALAERRRAS